MPCDMLFVKPEVLGVIKKTFHGQDAVLPMHSGLPRPLLGIYSGHRVAIMVERMRQRKMTMWDLLPVKAVQFLSKDEIVCVDPEGRSINTLEEYRNLRVHI